VVWEYTKAFDKRSVSSQVIASGLIIGSCGSSAGGNYILTVRTGDPAKGKKPEVAYEIRKSAPYVPTSVFIRWPAFSLERQRHRDLRACAFG